MNAPRMLAALTGLVVLSACFYSEGPLIPVGEQVTLPYDGVVLCLADDCRIVMAGDDGTYTIPPPREEADEKPLFVRFQMLTALGSGEDTNPVYLAEAQLQDGEEVSYHYLVAHIRIGATTHVPTYEFAMPACNNAADGALERFGIVRADTYSCRVTNLESFKTYLAEAYRADFETEEFWKDN